MVSPGKKKKEKNHNSTGEYLENQEKLVEKIQKYDEIFEKLK